MYLNRCVQLSGIFQASKMYFWGGNSNDEMILCIHLGGFITISAFFVYTGKLWTVLEFNDQVIKDNANLVMRKKSPLHMNNVYVTQSSNLKQELTVNMTSCLTIPSA